MSNKFLASPITVTQTGITIATSGTSAPTNGATIPLDSAGNNPRYIRVCATVAACIRLGTGNITAITTDLQIQPGDAVVLSTNGATKIAAIQVAAAGVVQVSPLENM
jgi:hypothetical protein